MTLKIKEYINRNYPDTEAKCNFISKILLYIIAISFTSSIAFSSIVFSSYESLTNIFEKELFETIATILIKITVIVLIYSSKCYLIVIPAVWIIQCWKSRKNRKENPWMLINLVIWLLVAALSWYCYDSNKREAECMEWCVKEDKSNYDECLFSTCDFPI